MNSLFRNVKAINIPTIKYLSRKLTPSLSTIEHSSPEIPNPEETSYESPRSKSLPPTLHSFPFEHVTPIDFHPTTISIDNQKFQRDKAGLTKPTLKIICKFRRNFSQKSFGKAKNKSQEKQIDRKRKQDIRDRFVQLPCIKPQNDSTKKAQQILYDNHDVRLKGTARDLHVSASTSSCSKSMSKFEDSYKQSPIKALLDLNDEAKSIQSNIRDIKAIQRKNRIKFHYLIENTECRQCVSKNKKRYADFYKKNENAMNKFIPKKRRYSTYTKDQSHIRFQPEQKQNKKEIVLVKDQNVTSRFQTQTITLFNLVKLQSSRPKPSFIPTNMYKFDAKQISDEYRFLPENSNNNDDPYPLEMFNDELHPAAFDTAKVIPPNKTASYPFIENDLEFAQLNDSRKPKFQEPMKNPFSIDNQVYHQSELEKILGFRANRNGLSLDRKKCPCTKSEHNRCRIKIPKKPNESDRCKKPKSDEPCKKRNPCNQNYKDLSSPITTEKGIPYTTTPLPSSSIYSTLEFAGKKCPCKPGKKRAPCKIPVPKTEENDDDPCRPPTKKDPCHKDNPSPCSRIPQYKTMSFNVEEDIPVNTDNLAIKPLSRRHSWHESNYNTNKVYFSDCLTNKNHQKIDKSNFMDIFIARKNQYKDLLHTKRPRTQPTPQNRKDYFFGQNSLDEKINDCINIMPKIELGEKSKQMLAASIKKMIEPIIEKEFLKYEEVKAALERMERHLAMTLSTLKPSRPITASQKHLNEKFPWKKINDVKIEEDNTLPEITDPKVKIHDHQDPVRRIAVNVPSTKRNESFEEPYTDNFDFLAKVNKKNSLINSKLKMQAASQKKDGNTSEEACKRADDLFKKGKKTDAFSDMIIRQDIQCKQEDPCKKEDPCNKEDSCKNEDPCKQSCNPCTKPETVSKVDPCNSFCKKEEIPCFPPPKPCAPPAPVVEPCDDRDPKGAVITCQKPVQEEYKPCTPKVSCIAPDEGFARKEFSCLKCPNTPKLKEWPPCSKGDPSSINSCDSKCPKDPSCDAKCPQVSCVECFQTPCKITDQPEAPKESLLNACSPKKPAPECCVNKSQEHGFIGMRELAKPDLTQNFPCSNFAERVECRKPRLVVTPTVSKSTPSAPKTKTPNKPDAETFMPAGCKKDDDKNRYCDASFLIKERMLKKKKEEQEEAKREEEKAQCQKVNEKLIKFDPETRNKWMPVTIHPSKTADKKNLQESKKVCNKPSGRLNTSKSEGTVLSKKPAKCKEKSLVETCSNKLSDLCMMIIRKQKGGKKAAPIVVTLSRSQPRMGILSDFSIIGKASGSGGNNGRKPDSKDTYPLALQIKEENMGTEETFLNLKETKASNVTDPNSLHCKKLMSEPSISSHDKPPLVIQKSSMDNLYTSIKRFSLRKSSQNVNQYLCKKKDAPSKKQETPSKKKEEPCSKSGSQDPKMKELNDCLKKRRSKVDIEEFENDPGNKKGDPCKKKEDPCKKKEDPCKKKEDPCKKKDDPCKKKEDPCKKKEDPCKKKEVPSKKKEDPSKKKEDPCKKKEDPCKKKDDPCKKKDDPCKKKEDPCKKKEDPCKKKEDHCKKKEDPCKKKEDPCKKKKDPCKKKEDPCKKKEDPCKKKADSCSQSKVEIQENSLKKADSCSKQEDPCKKTKPSCIIINAKQESNAGINPKNADSCIKDPCKRSKSAETTRAKSKSTCNEVTKKASSCDNKQKEDPCKKGTEAKKFCGKLIRTKSLCKPNKEDPCKKQQEDPCKKSEALCKQKEDPCKKKEDPCKKKEDPCKKKEDPCKKKEDPCKKKEDPCKKKEDPCKKKEDPCKKKEDPCKKKEDPCKKKEDPCKKKESKSEPCIPCKYEDYSKRPQLLQPKKEDPGKKNDPCKKKEDPCKTAAASGTDCAKKSSSKGDLCKKIEDPCQKVNTHPKVKGKFADCKAMLCTNAANDKCCEEAMNKPIMTGCKPKGKSFKKKYPWDELMRKVKECSSKKSKKDACKAKSDPCLSQRDKSTSKKTYSDTSISSKSSQSQCQMADKLLKKFKDEKACKPPASLSPCKKMKDDPCKKKEDPCKKQKEDPCKKSEDPCKKKENPCKKKEDPCKKKEDPCKKKDDPCKKKEDPCKKKEDPCKKKEDPCKKKEDPCKKKEDPCNKKEDPCKKKEDPCKKKEDPCQKKEDPCKKKEDPCKKKEDPSNPLMKKCAGPEIKQCTPDKKSRFPWNLGAKKELSCKKYEDLCKKTEDPCKKQEDTSTKIAQCIPCKYEDYSKKSYSLKKTDSCAKQEDPCKKKEDPCKKKEDPCKKKEDPCKKKEDPCSKSGGQDPKVKELGDCIKKKQSKVEIQEAENKCGDPCKKKEDPCKKKEDPCKKQKEDPCKKKEDPCKKKEDPCKKKEDPCKKKCAGLDTTQSMQGISSGQGALLPLCSLPKDETLRIPGRFSLPLWYDLYKQTSMFGICNPVYSRPYLFMRKYVAKKHMHTCANVWKLKSASSIEDCNVKSASKPSKRDSSKSKTSGFHKSALDLFPKKSKVDSSVGIIGYYQQKLKEEDKNKYDQDNSAGNLKYSGPPCLKTSKDIKIKAIDKKCSENITAADERKTSNLKHCGPPCLKTSHDIKCTGCIKNENIKTAVGGNRSGSDNYDHQALERLMVCLKQKNAQNSDGTCELKPLIECLESCGANLFEIKECSNKIPADKSLTALKICLKSSKEKCTGKIEVENKNIVQCSDAIPADERLTALKNCLKNARKKSNEKYEVENNNVPQCKEAEEDLNCNKKRDKDILDNMGIKALQYCKSSTCGKEEGSKVCKEAENSRKLKKCTEVEKTNCNKADTRSLQHCRPATCGKEERSQVCKEAENPRKLKKCREVEKTDCNTKDVNSNEELSKELLEAMSKILQKYCKSRDKKSGGIEKCNVSKKEADNANCAEKLNKDTPNCPETSKRTCKEEDAIQPQPVLSKCLEECKSAGSMCHKKDTKPSCVENKLKVLNSNCKTPCKEIHTERAERILLKYKPQEETKICQGKDAKKLSPRKKPNKEILERMARKVQAYCRSGGRRCAQDSNDTIAKNAQTLCKPAAMPCAQNTTDIDKNSVKCVEAEALKTHPKEELKHSTCIDKLNKEISVRMAKRAEEYCKQCVKKNDKPCEDKSETVKATEKKLKESICKPKSKESVCEKEISDEVCESEQCLRVCGGDYPGYLELKCKSKSIDKNKEAACKNMEATNKDLVCAQMKEVLNQVCKSDSDELKNKECKRIKKILSKPRTSLMCDDSKSFATSAMPVTAKQCKCCAPPVCEGPKFESVKDQSIQKGLKDLTILIPESEEPKIKDRGLLAQCFFAIKDRRHPVIQPISDEEIDKEICKGPQIVCKVQKYGLGEKLVCLDEKSGDCKERPDFDEDGVERILQCTVIRDKDNREKYFCTPLSPKHVDGHRYEIDSKKYLKDKYSEEANKKIKVISNKLVCAKCPSVDGNEEMTCTLATVEEVKILSNTCLKKKPTYCTKKGKKKCKRELSYNDLMQKYKKRSTRESGENCKTTEEDCN